MKVSSQSEPSAIKLIQITDTHLFAAEDGSLLSVNTADSFSAVVAAIVEEQVEFDALVATGDISQDHTPESYQRFVRTVAPLQTTQAQPKVCYWLPGNHDYPPSMHSVLPSEQIQAIEHVLLGEHWQMVLLDSQVSGAPHGCLSPAQLQLLDDQLSQHPQRHSLVLLHHHPLLVGSAWLDQHALKQSEDLWAVVAKHRNVRALLCGHVHQEMDRMHLGARVMATPSTCVQFKPNSQNFALDNCSPGWRELTLHADGQISSQVNRLKHGRFLPDFTSNGY